MSTAVAKLQPAQPQQVAVSDLKEMSLNYLAMPQVYDVMWRLSESMARARSMPKHLKDNPGDCFRIIEFANRIGQSPFALADSSFEVGGRIGYDGKAIAAMVNANPKLEGQLRYDYTGEGDALEVTVSGRLRGEAQERRVSATLKLGISDSRGARERWVKDPEQMLSYYAARRWARRHTPEVILGMYSPDELRAGAEGGTSIIDITPTQHDPDTGEVDVAPPPARPGYRVVDEFGNLWSTCANLTEAITAFGKAKSAATEKGMVAARNLDLLRVAVTMAKNGMRDRLEQEIAAAEVVKEQLDMLDEDAAKPIFGDQTEQP